MASEFSNILPYGKKMWKNYKTSELLYILSTLCGI